VSIADLEIRRRLLRAAPVVIAATLVGAAPVAADGDSGTGRPVSLVRSASGPIEWLTSVVGRRGKEVRALPCNRVATRDKTQAATIGVTEGITSVCAMPSLRVPNVLTVPLGHAQRPRRSVTSILARESVAKVRIVDSRGVTKDRRLRLMSRQQATVAGTQQLRFGALTLPAGVCIRTIEGVSRSGAVIFGIHEKCEGE
jgi:hypothetical protein